MGIERAHLVGNSLGGRVAIEVGLREPDRVRSLSLLCPSMAWRQRRHFVPIVKLLRPELAAIPHTFGDAARAPAVLEHVLAARADPSLGGRRRRRGVPAHLPLGERAGRVPRRGPAHLPRGAERPEAASGPGCGSSSRRRCSSGATRTRSFRSASRATCATPCPTARQVVLEQCGHVPQVEHPVDANALVHDFIGHAQASAARARRQAARPGRPPPAGADQRQRPPNGARATGLTRELTADAA